MSQIMSDTPLPPAIISTANDGEVLAYLTNGFEHLSWINWAWVGVFVHLTLTIFIIIRILSTQRNTGVAIAWLVLLFAIPFLSIVFYLLVGEPYLGKSYKVRNAQALQMLKKAINQDKLKAKDVDKLLPKSYVGVSRIGKHDTGFGVYDGHRMQLLTSANSTFDSLIKDIEDAQSVILMEFYIIFAKGRVKEVFSALHDAANRGVECHILADSVGSFSFFSDDWYEHLTQAGVFIHQSLPVGLFKTLFKRSDLRNHRKIVIIDEHIAYTGSFNLVDPEFFKQDKAVGQWIDVIMRIESDAPVSVVTSLATVNMTDISAESPQNLKALSQRIDEHINSYTRKLYRSTPAINDINDKAHKYLKNQILISNFSDEYGQSPHSSAFSYYHGHVVDLESENKELASKDTNTGQLNDTDNVELTDQSPIYHSVKSTLRIPPFDTTRVITEQSKVDTNLSTQPNIMVAYMEAVNNLPAVENVVAQMIPSAPRITDHVIYNTLLSIFHRANKRIQITTPYFVPDEALLSALTTAAKRGVEVTLIVPKKVDSFLVQHASQASYAILMEAGVKIALFRGGLLHAKTVVIDNDYCLFGTVNMDMRSFYLNMEVSLALFTPEIIEQVLACQHAYLTQCEMLDLEKWSSRPSYKKLFDSGIRLFSPLL